MKDFIKVKITNPNDLLFLHNTISAFDGDFTVHVGKNISVDGKSLVGLMAISQNIIEIQTTLQDTELDLFKLYIRGMIID